MDIAIGIIGLLIIGELNGMWKMIVALNMTKLKKNILLLLIQHGVAL